MTQPRDRRGRFVSAKAPLHIVGRACMEGCCVVVRDYAYDPSVMSEEQYVRPMFQVLDEGAVGENVYFYWDTAKKSFIDEDGDYCDSGGNKIDRTTREGRSRLGAERGAHEIFEEAVRMHQRERQQELREHGIDVTTLSDRELREMPWEVLRTLSTRSV